MAVLQPKNMYRGYLGVGSPSAASVLYTAPVNAGSYSIVKEVVLCNTGATIATVDLYTIESAGSVAANRKIISSAEIDPGTTVVFEMSTVLEDQDTIRGAADPAAQVTATISGVEFSV